MAITRVHLMLSQEQLVFLSLLTDPQVAYLPIIKRQPITEAIIIDLIVEVAPNEAR